MNYKEPLLSTADIDDDEDDHLDAPQFHKQPTYRKVASQFSTLSRQKKSDAYTEIVQFSSFIPNKRTGLIEIEYEVHEKTINIKHRIAYVTTVSLFIIFYILLFIDATFKIAQYMTLILSLALSLLYTLLPSSIKIPIPFSCVKVEPQDTPDTKHVMMNILCRKQRIPLEQWTVPPLCVLLLIASTKFSYTLAWSAMVGTHYPKGILPWDVLGVLFGLCYLCITLDLTGILKAFATKTAAAAEPYPLKLFIYIFIFAAVLTCVTNNDISIICLTPLVISTANSGNIDADPFIFLVLFASNTFSMLLVTGNPANLIVSASAELGYISYAKIMAIPTIVVGFGLLLELYLMFRTKLQTKYHCKQNDKDWKQLIKLPKYAVFCAIRLLVTCVLLLVTAFIESFDAIPGHDMYVVLGIAAISLIIDLCAFDIPRCVQLTKQQERNVGGLLHAAKAASQPSELEYAETDPDHPLNTLRHIRESKEMDVNINQIEMHSTNASKDRERDACDAHSIETYDSNHIQNAEVMSFAVDALWELPWNLIPFVLSLFILVEFMNEIGLVSQLSDVLVAVSNDNEWIAMFVVGFTATVLCQCVNNQPMTVLLSTILFETKQRNEAFRDCCSEGAYFALAVGANLGGNGTPVASLAVLMWKSILEKWSLSISYIGFSKRGIPVTPLLVAICITVIGVELQYLHF